MSDEKRAYLNVNSVIGRLKKKYGEEHGGRIAIGVKQAAALWRKKDGTPGEFAKFCLEHFVADSKDLDKLFQRFQDNLEQIGGHFHEMARYLETPLNLDTIEDTPVDQLFSEWSPGAHVDDDFFEVKLAFVVLLNFRLYELEERLKDGPDWPRRKWAEVRLASSFQDRVPAYVGQAINRAYVAADLYIKKGNFYMGNVIVGGGKPFPEDLKLMSHWGLRDCLKGLYVDKDGLSRQRAIFQIMNRVVNQTVPRVVINNPNVSWDPFTDEREPEPDTRYKLLLDVFKAVKSEDIYHSGKTHIDRKFDSEREIPEARFEELMLSVLTSPVAARIGGFVSRRLGRQLEPFDFWYNQFVPQKSTEELDALVRAKYPTVEALSQAMPDILMQLGFDRARAGHIAERIVLRPSKSAGQANGAERREDKHYLSVRFPKGDILHTPDYMAFNVFMHEFGHAVEMYFSLHATDYHLLNGVPNTAFTEALAFVWQDRDLEILGVASDDIQGESLNNLMLFWNDFEMAGVGLIDMRIWHWMYANPKASPAELKTAVVGIANEVWNDYFAPIFGVKDQPILAVYSHLIYCMLYTPDYFLGTLIQHQIQEYLKGKNLAKEVERMYTLGNLTPELWMQKAVGAPISAEPLIKSAEEALSVLEEK